MSVARTIIKNTLVTILGSIVGRVLSFFLIIAIAKYLGDVGMGIYTAAFAFIGLVGLANDFGLSQLMIRDIAKNPNNSRKLFNNFLALKVILGVLALAAGVLLSFFVAQSQEAMMAIWIAAIGTFFFEFAGALTVLFSAHEKMEYNSIVTTLERFLSVAFGLAVLLSGKGIIMVMVAFAASYFLTFLAAYFITTKKFFPIGLELDFKLWKQMMKEALPFWMTGVFNTIYFRIDTVMLSRISGYAATGWYGAAHALLDALYFIPGSIIAAVFPAMSKLSIGNRKILNSVYNRTFYYLFMLALPLGIGTTLLADRIIPFIYPGGQFTNSIIILKILIWAEVIIFVSYLNGYLLNSINKQKLFTIATATGAVVNVALNLVLIPKYSFVGASVALVATEVFVFAMLLYFTLRSGFSVNFVHVILKPVIGGAVMAASIIYSQKFVPEGAIGLSALAAIGGMTYFAMMVLTRGLGKEELGMVRGFIGK